MNAVVFEHVPVAELPQEWRARLAQAEGGLVTVRIEQEPVSTAPRSENVQRRTDPAFGIWHDRDDLGDATDHVRRLRAGRYKPDGSRNAP